uniref:Tyrosine-protein phosphatase domain-containing protein n=1 Tax=Strongyloides venezuelensis TaxID=75913 RepID=A0A0K0FS21_STRVS
MSKYSKRQLNYMSKHKRDSTSPFDGNFLTNKEYEEIYLNIDDVKSRSKKKAIADERIGNGGSHHGKRIKANVKIIKENGHKPRKRLLQMIKVYLMGLLPLVKRTRDEVIVARCTDGMSSQGTKTANNIAFWWKIFSGQQSIID